MDFGRGEGKRDFLEDFFFLAKIMMGILGRIGENSPG